MKKFIEERIAVKCETREELKKFLERCGKEGLKWISKTEATKYTPTCNPTYMTYGFNFERGLEYAGECFLLEARGWKVVTYKEYFDTHKYKVGDIVESEFGKGEIKEITSSHVPYLVYHYDWGGGHNACGRYTGGHCWFFKEEEIKLAEQITITRHGDKVVAKYGEKVGVAKCSPEDEFNFEVGAKLALERLFGTTSTVQIVKEVSRQAKVGEYIKIVNAINPSGYYENGDILKVEKLTRQGNVGIKDIGILPNEYVVLEGYKPTTTEPKKEFKPHLSGFGRNYGYIGEEVGFTDVLLKDLYVGDIVELYNVEEREMVGKYFVCKQDGKGFVMSVAASKFKDGISNNIGEWRIKKVKSYKDLKHDVRIGGIRVILKDEK